VLRAALTLGLLLLFSAPVHAQELLAELSSMLWSEDQRVASVAVDELSAYGVPGGEAALLAATEDSRWTELDPDLRAQVLQGLRQMGSRRALKAFTRAALEDDGPVSRAGIRGLVELGGADAEAALKAVAEQGDRRKQSWIVRSLRQVGARDAAKTARTEVRTERREDRSERREGRKETRTERKEERKETRTERKEERKETRTERKEERKERKEERRERRGDSDDEEEETDEE